MTHRIYFENKETPFCKAAKKLGADYIETMGEEEFAVFSSKRYSKPDEGGERFCVAIRWWRNSDTVSVGFLQASCENFVHALYTYDVTDADWLIKILTLINKERTKKKVKP